MLLTNELRGELDPMLMLDPLHLHHIEKELGTVLSAEERDCALVHGRVYIIREDFTEMVQIETILFPLDLIPAPPSDIWDILHEEDCNE